MGERSRHQMGNGLLTHEPVSKTPAHNETSSGGRVRSMMISSTQPPESAFGMKDARQQESDSGTSLQRQEARQPQVDLNQHREIVDNRNKAAQQQEQPKTLGEFKDKNAQLQAMLMQMQTPEFNQFNTANPYQQQTFTQNRQLEGAALTHQFPASQANLLPAASQFQSQAQSSLPSQKSRDMDPAAKKYFGSAATEGNGTAESKQAQSAAFGGMNRESIEDLNLAEDQKPAEVSQFNLQTSSSEIHDQKVIKQPPSIYTGSNPSNYIIGSGEPTGLSSQGDSRRGIIERAIAQQDPSSITIDSQQSVKAASAAGSMHSQQIQQPNTSNNRRNFKPPGSQQLLETGPSDLLINHNLASSRLQGGSTFQTAALNIMGEKENYDLPLPTQPNPQVNQMYSNNAGGHSSLSFQPIQSQPQQQPPVSNYNQYQNHDIIVAPSNLMPQLQPQAQMQYNAHIKTQLQPPPQQQEQEFTLAPRQPQQPAKLAPQAQQMQNFPSRDQIVHKHGQIMQHFDDIPITQIKKMDGYQTGPQMYGDGTRQEATPHRDSPGKGSARMFSEGENGNLTEEGEDLSIEDRVFSTKWRVRVDVFKELHRMFEQPDAQQNLEKFGSLLQQMIKDSNLVAAYEALNCLHIYVKNAKDIKAVTFATHNFLLEKVQHTKQNFRDITMKIVLAMLHKEQGTTLFPELLKRFRSKKTSIAAFSMQVVTEVFKTKTGLDDLNLKTVFRSIQEVLGHQIKDLRSFAYQLLEFVFVNCSDDVSTVIANCKNLRPVQHKELSTMLQKAQKTQKSHTLTLFTEVPGSAAESMDQVKEGPAAKPGLIEMSADDFNSEEAPVRDQPLEAVDLLTLIPANFTEIPYLTQINVKKKAMESFNDELKKLISRKDQTQIKQKDYSTIMNIIAHMLEDKNMLVFVEAIKTVELLSILLGTAFNQNAQKKVKIFTTLIAQKYGETKTAVIAAVDKCMDALVDHGTMTYSQFTDLIMKDIVSGHKNPRVKQLLIEKPVANCMKKCDQAEAIVIFKSLKDKIVTLILKDTNASVRDACINLLVTFKIILVDAGAPITQLFDEVIEQLPKYRKAEVLKKITDATSDRLPVRDNMHKTMVDADSKNLMEEHTEAATQPKFARSLTEKIKESKKAPTKRQEQTPHNEFDIRMFPLQCRAMIGVIVEDLNKFAAGQFDANAEQLQGKWNEVLRNRLFGQQSFRECKPVFVALANRLIVKSAVKWRDFPAHLKTLLAFLKQLFTMEMSISRDRDGHSTELVQLLELSLLHNEFLPDSKRLTCQMLSVAMHATGDVFEFTEVLREVVEMDYLVQNKASLAIIDSVYLWLGQKRAEFIQAGMQISDLEELRGFGLKYLDKKDIQSETRQALIGIMIRFKDQVTAVKQEAESQGNSGTLDNQNEEPRPQTQSYSAQDEKVEELPQKHRTEPSQASDPSSRHQTIESISTHQGPASAADIVHLMDRDFERGLLLFKELAQQQEQQLPFEYKQLVFDKLLEIVGMPSGGNIQQQQYKQAYALKALMWMKEETMGVEDCFRLTEHVLLCYLRAELSGRQDSSVEQYLLNFWVKELSVRDLSDRIQAALQIIQTHEHGSGAKAKKQEIAAFKSLFAWLVETKLSDENDDDWSLQDLRKVVLSLTDAILDNDTVCIEFMRKCVQRQTHAIVKEFMEIQLMHANDVYIKFVDWFDQAFPTYDVPLTPREFSETPASRAPKQSAPGSGSSATNQTLQARREQRKLEELNRKHEQSIMEANKVNEEELINQSLASLISVKEQHPLEATNTSAYYQDLMQKSVRYEDEEDKNVFTQQNVNKENNGAYSNQVQDSVYAAKSRQLELSEAKSMKWRKQMDDLQSEKERIERERESISALKNKEGEEFESRIGVMRREHEKVVCDLNDVNNCYQQQVDENEKLKEQLDSMQAQHTAMMSRFEEIEKRIQKQPPPQPERNVVTPDKIEISNKKNKNLLVSVTKLQRIEDTFEQDDDQATVFGVQKIQELLVAVEKNVDGELVAPLLYHYSKIKQEDERIKLISAMRDALDQNEDVLYALSVDVYKALLNFLLRAFAKEKEYLERQSSFMENNQQPLEQNIITSESQKLVSKLLNSKEFTTSLVCLFQLLRDAMPSDITLQMTIEERQYLRVIMRCIQRISKALHSEQPELVRAFDVLLEMQKMFVKHPPEQLREDLPCLADFDFVYRAMKDVSDKLIDLQPDKVHSFLEFSRQSQPNAFIKYLNQMVPASSARDLSYTPSGATGL